MFRVNLALALAVGFLIPSLAQARDKAPFSICVITSDIPDKDELKRVKNLIKHLDSRFLATSTGTEPETCSSNLYLIRMSQETENDSGFASGFGSDGSQTTVTTLKVIGFDVSEEVAVDQIFEGGTGKWGWSFSKKGGSEKKVVKKIYEWADDNQVVIAAKLGIELPSK